MNRPVLAAVCGVIAFATTLRAQDMPSDVHQQTAAPVNARFEIVESELAARWTFRLDRFTGHVAMIVTTPDSSTEWQDMEVLGLPAASTPTRPHFQIFTSGLAAKWTFLIDTDTGKTWVLTTDTRTQADFWGPLS